MNSPKYLFLSTAVEIGPMFVTSDEPTRMDFELAMLGLLKIVRLQDRTSFDRDTEDWETLPLNTVMPDVLTIELGVIVPPPDFEEDEIHVHPSVA
jgi:hypothetical protein